MKSLIFEIKKYYEKNIIYFDLVRDSIVFYFL